MDLPDTNIWLALTFPEHVFHGVATQWLAGQSNPKHVLFCRSTQQSFLRLATTSRIFIAYGFSSISNAEAWQMYDQLVGDPRIAFASEPGNLERRWRQLSGRATASPKMWMDAYLAAFAIEGGHQLVTTDEGFEQYKTLKPLILR